MRLLFLVPSSAHKMTAGSRIRYDRLAHNNSYFDVSIKSLAEISIEDLSACDVLILSKTYSVEAIAIARTARSLGKLAGLDLFDDYFTQWRDARPFRFRQWLRIASRTCDFALCSTPVMRRAVAHYAPDLPIHVLPDPFEESETETLAQIVSEKLARAQRDRRIDALWFGIGSNTTFPVGLRDLSACSSGLRTLALSGFKTRLTILTNSPALKTERLAQLSRLPIDYRLDEWSLEAERKALAEAFVCFLPVNGQSFSRAKSLNRALTSISAGAQVLSPGFPLYAELDPAIYVDPAELVKDIETGRCRIRRETSNQICAMMAQVSSVGSLARDLFDFLSCAIQTRPVRRPAGAPEKIALIYGAHQDIAAVKGANSAGLLSVRSPFARVSRAYDIHVDYRPDRRFEIWVTPEMKPYVAKALEPKFSPPEKRGKQKMNRVDVGDAVALDHAPILSSGDLRPILHETEAYRHLLGEVERVCRRLFPDFSFFLSEVNAYPAAPNAERSPVVDS